MNWRVVICTQEDLKRFRRESRSRRSWAMDGHDMRGILARLEAAEEFCEIAKSFYDLVTDEDLIWKSTDFEEKREVWHRICGR